MPLSNEQRAHDLAVASLPFINSMIIQQKLTGKDIEFDLYFEYKKLYEDFLDAVSKDFK
ncbi:hypothetical protein [Enterococcus thailandicus]